MTKRKIIALSTIFTVIILANIIILYQHEQAHQMIFKYFGVESEVKMELLGGSTIPSSEIPQQERAIIYSLHAMNEIVGYQITALFNATVIIIFCTLLYIDLGTTKANS